MVDDAIIVVEAVEHHIEEGKSPREATIQAMKEVGGPVIAIALILSVCFSAGCVHGRHPGATEQSVCDDHCDLDAHLGVQCVDAFACACGDVVEAAAEIDEEYSAASSAGSIAASTK